MSAEDEQTLAELADRDSRTKAQMAGIIYRLGLRTYRESIGAVNAA